MKKFQFKKFLREWDWETFFMTVAATLFIGAIIAMVIAVIVFVFIQVGWWLPVGIVGAALLFVSVYAVVWWVDDNGLSAEEERRGRKNNAYTLDELRRDWDETGY